MFADELDWGEFVAPDKALPVTSSKIDRVQPLIVNADTGGGRGRRPGVIGSRTVEGPIITGLYGGTLGFLFRTMYLARSSVAAGTGWKTKMMVDDDQDQSSLSFQKRYKGTVAESIRGGKLNGYTIGARAKEFATVELRWIAKDSAGSGGKWADDTDAPFVVDPVPYLASEPDKLKFNEGVLAIGGSAAIVDGEIVISGATDRCEFDNLQLVVNNNLSNNGFGVCLGDVTVQSVDEGIRAITMQFEPNFATVDEEFYNAWGDGADMTALLRFQSLAQFDTGRSYEFLWALPLVRMSGAPNPELNAARGLKRQIVAADAYADPGLSNVDHSLTIISTEDYA